MFLKYEVETQDPLHIFLLAFHPVEQTAVRHKCTLLIISAMIILFPSLTMHIRSCLHILVGWEIKSVNQ